MIMHFSKFGFAGAAGDALGSGFVLCALWAGRGVLCVDVWAWVDGCSAAGG